MIRTVIKRLAEKAGYTVERTAKLELGMEEFLTLYPLVRPHTLSTKECLYSLYTATVYISESCIPGDVVECGVWKGGCAMMAALTLKARGDSSRRLVLYDTYEGMPSATDKDVDWQQVSARELVTEQAHNRAHPVWCRATLDQAQRNVWSTGYPKERIVFVKGKVEETIPAHELPDRIAILRLDTDWFESTYHALRHLFPRLSTHGVLIINDYGHWKGAREAVDRYFQEQDVHMLLHRTDYSERIGLKIS